MKKPLCFIWKIVKKSNFALFYCVFFAFLAQKGENTTAGEQKPPQPPRSSLQIPLGNRNWSRARRPPARSRARTKRNDFPVGATSFSPPQPPIKGFVFHFFQNFRKVCFRSNQIFKSFFYHWTYRRLGGESEPNREIVSFRSCVRTRGLVA